MLKGLVFGAKCGGAFHLHKVHFGIVGCVHPVGKEQTTVSHIGVVGIFLVAHVDKATLAVITGGEESAMRCSCARQTHFRTTVEGAISTTGNHQVKLVVAYVVTDVASHDNQVLALDRPVGVIGGGVRC